MFRRLGPSCLVLLAGCVCVAGVVGCALLNRSNEQAKNAKGERTTLLPGIASPHDAIQLEFVFVDRPYDDPMLGDALWDDVDQVAALSVDVRSNIREAGFRVGQVGCTPPDALERLLGLTSGIDGRQHGNEPHKFTVRRVALPSGAETEIETSSIYPVRRVAVPGGQATELKEFSNARCVLRVRAKRVQDGWAKLEFIPEIHHGPSLPRPSATRAGWQIRTSQSIEPLFGLRFSLNLALNEMVLISADTDQVDAPGYQFFRGGDAASFGQRLLLVRLADMHNVEPVYTD